MEYELVEEYREKEIFLDPTSKFIIDGLVTKFPSVVSARKHVDWLADTPPTRVEPENRTMQGFTEIRICSDDKLRCENYSDVYEPTDDGKYMKFVGGTIPTRTVFVEVIES